MGKGAFITVINYSSLIRYNINKVRITALVIGNKGSIYWINL